MTVFFYSASSKEPLAMQHPQPSGAQPHNPSTLVSPSGPRQPSDAELFALLHVKQREFAADPQGGFRITHKHVPLYHPTAANEYSLPGHLQCQLRARCHPQTEGLATIRHRSWPDHLRCRPLQPQASPWEQILHTALREHCLGRVLLPSHVPPYRVVLTLAQWLPQGRLLVGCPHRKAVHELFDIPKPWLKQRLYQQYRDEPLCNYPGSGVILIVQQNWLSAARGDQWDLLVATDAAAVSRLAVGQHSGFLNGIPALALQYQTTLNDTERRCLEATFGPDTLDLRPTRYPLWRRFLCPAPDSPSKTPKHPLLWKRQHLWQHSARNRRILELAQALHQQDTQRLQAWGLPAWTGSQPPRVAVLVENTEHAQQLQQRQTNGLPGAATPGGQTSQPVTFLTHSTVSKAAAVDVLIHADLSCPVDLLPRSWSKLPLWLIDLDGPRKGLGGAFSRPSSTTNCWIPSYLSYRMLPSFGYSPT